MDINNTNQPSAVATEYQALGKKVFWLFFLQGSVAAFILFLIAIIIFILSFQPFLTNGLLGNVQKYAIWAAFTGLLFSLIIAAGSLATAWLNYTNYKFMLAENSFKIRRGIMNKTENAIPYRQIQNVDIERNFTFQMLGLSRLIILTAGREDEKSQQSDEAEGVIPAIDKKLAEWLQAELLKRAEVQKVVQQNNNL